MNTIIKYQKEIDEYINNVFNYYNGRINVFNYPAKLCIEWGYRADMFLAGATSNPNKVYIYPEMIIEFCNYNMDSIKYLLYATIIHELHHIDQFINYIKYANDSYYKNYIEGVVELYSTLYMASHRYETIQFGIYDIIEQSHVIDVALHQSQPHLGKIFNRKQYVDHFISMMHDIMYDGNNNKEIKKFIKIFNNPETIIHVNINNRIEYTLKNKMYCIGIPQLNQIMDDEIFQYNYRYGDIIIEKLNKTTYRLNISSQGYHKLFHMSTI